MMIYFLIVLISFNLSVARNISVSTIGKFNVYVDIENPYILITSQSNNNEKILFQTIQNWPFVSVGYATSFFSRSYMIDGNYKPDQWTLYETPYQNIKSVRLVQINGLKGEKQEKLILTGEVWGSVTQASYEMTFHIPDEDDLYLINQLEYSIKVNFLIPIAIFSFLFTGSSNSREI